jgi:23S rRNA pseudouridine1911/1915/1917 synthase
VISKIENCISIEITKEDAYKYKRLDRFLSDNLKDISRSSIKKLFLDGHITWSKEYLNQNEKLELKKLPKVGAIINISIPPPTKLDVVPENIPLNILFQDEHLLIIDKAAGMVTHPAPGHSSGTLVNAVLYHCKDLAGIGNKIRPGIVHRLDKGTSGVMVVAKTQLCHEKLVALFATHDITRKYETLVIGHKINECGTLNSTIGRHSTNRLKMAANVTNGKNAITHYKVLAYYKSLAHLELKLETGRTHQIRVHLSSLLNRPILLDPLYANKNAQLKQLPKKYNTLLHNYPHQLLHAKLLGFIHPITNKNLLFETDPPDTFMKTLDIAKNE